MCWSVNNSIFFTIILLIVLNIGWIQLGKLGLKVIWQILISTSRRKEDGYNTNSYVQFMKEVKVILLWKWKKVKVLVTQSCPNLCNPMDCSLPGFSVHGILQTRLLEWIAISFSRGSSQPRDQTWVSRITGRFFIIWATREVAQCIVVKSLSRVRLFATPWTVAYNAPPSMRFSRQEYCSGLPFPSPGDLPNPGIKPVSPESPDSGGFFTA